MKYTRVYIDAFGYELAPVVVTSEELEQRLAPAYEALRLRVGQLEALTGIAERRWWDRGYRVSDGAAAAGRKAMEKGGVDAANLGALIYAGVCREYFEPATACRVAALLGLSPNAVVCDVSNACLGVLNGMVDVANRIELGQIRAGMVVACETAREVNEAVIDELNRSCSMDLFADNLTAFTCGAGAAAVLLTDGSFGNGVPCRRLRGGAGYSAPQHHDLCRWGIREVGASGGLTHFTKTDSPGVLKYGVELGAQTWRVFLHNVGWTKDEVDRVVCHQVASSHQRSILEELGISGEKDYATYPHLGNMGTVSLPVTAAIAEGGGFLNAGDRVGLLGIGSGLNCLMLGVEW